MKQIYHHWENWECYKAGFYNTTSELSEDEGKNEYRKFLKDLPRFEKALTRVTREWKHSCEQFLSNENINRIAWLGQASMCIDSGIPSCFKGGFRFLSHDEQNKANKMAEKYLYIWLRRYEKKDKQVYLFVEE